MANTNRNNVDTVPAPAGSKRENRYYFRCKDGGKVYSVPKLGYISGEGGDFIVNGMEQGFDDFKMTRELLAIECPAAADDIKAMTRDQIAYLSTRWAEVSMITPGESSGSEDS
jgi:hypothetical protein